jgi:DNA-binding MarR family transcriptional regulator
MSARNELSETLALEVEKDLGVALMRTAFVMRQALQKRLAGAEPRLSPMELAILHMLTLADGQRVGDLADMSNRDRTTLTRIADRMVDKALIDRRVDPDDRRAVRLHLTDAGKHAHARLLPLREELIESATGHISARERARMIRALTAMREQLLSDMGEEA